MSLHNHQNSIEKEDKSMKRFVYWGFMAFLLLFTPMRALGVPADTLPITQIQPDGTEIKVRMFGDEKGVIYTDLGGNVVLTDQDSTWKYVLKSGDAYELGGIVQPGEAPAPTGGAAYVLMSDLNEDIGQEKLTALKKTLIIASGGTDKAPEQQRSNTVLIIACVAAALVIVAAVLFFVKRKRAA